MDGNSPLKKKQNKKKNMDGNFCSHIYIYSVSVCVKFFDRTGYYPFIIILKLNSFIFALD